MAIKFNKDKTVFTITFRGEALAHIFKSNLSAEGVKFLTPDEYTLQTGLIEHPKGKIITDHQHNPKIKYKVDTTQEFLYLERGRVKVKYFSEDWKPVAEIILEKGDFLLHISGAHGFEVLRKCRMIEVKQGPFPGDKNLKFFRE